MNFPAIPASPTISVIVAGKEICMKLHELPTILQLNQKNKSSVIFTSEASVFVNDDNNVAFD